MINKSFINKCLFFLNKVGYKYNNVSYGITRFNSFVSIFFQIWDNNRDKIIKTFAEKIASSDSFENMKMKLNEFIKYNKELLC